MAVGSPKSHPPASLFCPHFLRNEIMAEVRGRSLTIREVGKAVRPAVGGRTRPTEGVPEDPYNERSNALIYI
jgi:hypothetical protein